MNPYLNSAPNEVRRFWMALMVLLAALNAPAAWGDLRIGGNLSLFNGAGFQSSPEVAADARSGQFLVVWTSNEPISADSDVLVNRVRGRFAAADGSLSSASFLIAESGANPAVVFNTVNQEYWVVYERSDAGNNGIFARRISAAGNVGSAEFVVHQALAQVDPVIAYDPVSNRYLLVWTSGNQAILYRLFDRSGSPVTPATQLTAQFTVSGSPVVAYDPQTARYLIVYESASSTVTDILGQLLDADGAPVGSILPIATAAARQSAPRLAQNRDGQYLVVWNDERNLASTGSNVFGQLVDVAAGSLSGKNLLLKTFASGPVIGFSTVQGRFFLSWVAKNPDDVKNGFLLGRFLKSDLSGRSDIFSISETAGVTGGAGAILGDDGLALVAWAQGRGSDSRIRAQLIDVSTALTRLSVVVSTRPTTVDAGQPLTYTLVVRNDGLVTAKAVNLTDTLGGRFVSATASGGSCGHGNGEVTCALGNLEVNKKLTVKLVVTPENPGTLTNKAVLDWSNNSGNASKTTVITKTKVSYPGSLNLSTPNGGERIPAGSSYDIAWMVKGAIPGDVLTFNLAYSLDNGVNWSSIAKGVAGDHYRWSVPVPSGNKRKARIRVTGFNAQKVEIDRDVSDTAFAIEVVNVTSPTAGEVLNAGHVAPIGWNTLATRREVARVFLSYSRNGGTSWKRIAVLEGNPGTYAWTLPGVSKPASRSLVKVVLKDALGRAVGSALSSRFTIAP